MPARIGVTRQPPLCVSSIAAIARISQQQ